MPQRTKFVFNSFLVGEGTFPRFEIGWDIKPLIHDSCISIHVQCCFHGYSEEKRDTTSIDSEINSSVAAMHAIAFGGGGANAVETVHEVAKLVTQSEPKNSRLCFRLVGKISSDKCSVTSDFTSAACS